MSYVLPEPKQIEVLRMLSEGNSLSSITRLTGVHRGTISRLMLRFAEACRLFLDRELRDLELRHVELDELQTFCKKKEYNLTELEKKSDDIGMMWIFIALDQDTRLIPAHRVGKRDDPNLQAFVNDLASRFKKPRPHASDAHAFKIEAYKPIVRISTDGYIGYPGAINQAFGPYAEHGVLKKEIKNATDDLTGKKIKVVNITKEIKRGDIAPKDITTSLVERSNLTTRTFVRRTTRKTIAFSKCVVNLRAAVTLHVTAYNYCWRVRTTKRTPAVAAGIAPRQYSFAELYYMLREMSPALFYLQEDVA